MEEENEKKDREEDLIGQDFCGDLIEFVKKESNSLWQKQAAKLEKKLNGFMDEVKTLNKDLETPS